MNGDKIKTIAKHSHQGANQESLFEIKRNILCKSSFENGSIGYYMAPVLTF